MPVVLVTDAPTASGHTYNDVIGKQYEFPVRYRALVKPGDSFLYYRGSRGSRDGRAVYFGSGVIGKVYNSSQPEHLIADVHDIELFDEPLAAKRSDGTYLETNSTRRTNWANGVRRISEATAMRILSAVDRPPTATPRAARGIAFASPEHATAIERYSVSVAVELLAAEFSPACVTEMPPGNPGYDLRVRDGSRELHVEVKGTVLNDPVFHLSEGQRQHAMALGADFRLIVVYKARPADGTHQIAVLGGPLDATKVDLQPEAWTGRVVL